MPEQDLAQRLQIAGIRPTRQRIALAALLFDPARPHRHVTADELFAEVQAAGQDVALATVYNTLNQFQAAGLVREVVVEPGRTWFDTNLDDHHHLFYEDQGHLSDLPLSAVPMPHMPTVPDGLEVARVDVIVRVRPRG